MPTVSIPTGVSTAVRSLRCFRTIAVLLLMEMVPAINRATGQDMSKARWQTAAMPSAAAAI